MTQANKLYWFNDSDKVIRNLNLMKYEHDTKLVLMSNVFLKPPTLGSTFNPIVFVQDIGAKQDAYRFLTPFSEFDTNQGKLK